MNADVEVSYFPGEIFIILKVLMRSIDDFVERCFGI